MRLEQAEGGMEKYGTQEKENTQLGNALAVIWCEIHCLHDDVSQMMDMMDMIRLVNKHRRIS